MTTTTTTTTTTSTQATNGDGSLYLAIGVVCAGVFIADLQLPLGIAVWVLYCAPLVLSSFSRKSRTPIIVGVVCSALLIGGYFFSSAGGLEARYAPINRTFAFFTYWAVALIGQRFVIARLAVIRQDWVKAAQTGLGTKIEGKQTHTELGESILSFLAEHFGANVGAIYLASEDDDKSFRRFASFAIDKKRAGPEIIKNGDGLIGQAASDNRLMHVSNVPSKYLDVRSSVGRHAPAQLVVAPASIDGKVHAVIELGFLREVAREDLDDVFARVQQSIASAVRSVTYQTRQQELLEETQTQAEKLQTQQEELRVQNEELEQQSKSLQEAQSRLENQHAELEQINSHLSSQTAALEHQRDELQTTHGELKRANTYKSEFLANMSHELRTPLNSSLILAKLLMDNREGNLTGEQIKFAQTIYSAGNDLLTLINDILDLSKIEAGKIDIRPEKVTLTRVVTELESTFRHIANEKQIELTTKIDGPADVIETDATRLQQILKNLLSNALKFTEPGGRVSLRIRRVTTDHGKRLSFAVTDTGIGIPPEQHEVVFEAFRQADGTTNRKYGGTGLGLSISRDLARLLGGEMMLESTPKRGSTFTLLLPEEYAGAAIASPPQQQTTREIARTPKLPPVVPPPPRPSTRSVRPASPRPNRTILVIEDDRSFAKIIEGLATELDLSAMFAETGEEGLALAEEHNPSAIVLDIGLPDRSGLSVLDALKHNPSTRHIPVHVVSASDYMQTALEMGATGYAIKPVKREELSAALHRLEAKSTQKLRRVLVVEDDAVLREATCRLLATNGASHTNGANGANGANAANGDASKVETIAVGSATEALEQLRTSTFDCMVLDLSLPDRSGLEVLEEMARKEQYSFPPVIVYTGRSLSHAEEQDLRRFSSSIIIKGARSPERLLDEVTLFLHQMESELPPDRQRMLRDVRNREAIFEGRRVLIVEDDVRNVFALTSVLEPKGAKVEIARNGREALEHLKNKPGVDLVLMDIMMPEMDGLEATREIRKQPELAKVPIIALTAKAMADDRESCLAAGANDYIAKPLDVDKLLSLARVWMAK